MELIFKNLKDTFQDNFYNKISSTNDILFEVDIDKDKLWELYLDSFPVGTNEIYRKRREMDCSACKSFIRKFGNVVCIEDNNIKSVWDFKIDNEVFQKVIDTLSKRIYEVGRISDRFLSKEEKIGIDVSRELVEDRVITWEHFYLDLPHKFVNKRRGKSVDTIKSDFRSIKEVFKRSLEEITQSSVNEVLEIINSGSLYRGAEWKRNLEEFKKYQKIYSNLSENEKDNWLWSMTATVGGRIGKIRNHSIGTLLLNVSEGMDLDQAVSKYEKIVAPENYKRPKAIYTKKMVDEAKNKIKSLGYKDSLARRFANILDVNINNVLFLNRDSTKKLSSDVFEEMENELTTDPKKFNRCEEITLQNFIEKVLPTTNTLEVLVQNRHLGNFVSLIAPVNKEAKSMFKWDNLFSWAYTGNMTDSIKNRVKELGGDVDGDLNFRLAWNFPEDQYDNADLDNHCNEPDGHMIYYQNKRILSDCGGMLDVDIVNPQRNQMAVENILFKDKMKMTPGDYLFFINCFNKGFGAFGFRSELEIEGEKYEFDYPYELKQNEKVEVCRVNLDENRKFTIKELIPSNLSNREVWGVKTNSFVPVEVLMKSPNFWNEESIGNEHVFFMLKDCKNPENPNGFYNEFLKNDLVTHKRFFEALGNKMKVEESDKQLSGLGFSLTMKNTIIVKVKGHTERIMKIKF